MGDARNEDPRDDRDWVDRAAALAGRLGLNAVRVRWRLEAWRERWRRRREAAATRMEHARYRHQSCPQCGKLADGHERVCGSCGARLPSPASRTVRRIGLSLPGVINVSTLLSIAMLAVHLRLLIAQGGSPLDSFHVSTLVRFGAHWPPLVAAGEWWRLGTACFLHVGLWHILFNLMALSQIGPGVEQLFGRLRMLLFFVLTGVAGNLVSELFGLHAVSAGASGGLMGLIGVAAGWGHRSGTSPGRDLRNRMLTWGLYTVAFGLFIHADNGAHVGGFAAGALIGLLVPAQRSLPAAWRPAFAALDVVGLLAAGACVFLAVHPPAGAYGADGEDAASVATFDADVAGMLRQHYAEAAATCRLRAAGRTDEALARLRAIEEGGPGGAAGAGGPDAGSATATPAARRAELDEFCDGIRELQQRCAEFPRWGLRAFLPDENDLRRFGPDQARLVEQQMQVMCDAVRP